MSALREQLHLRWSSDKFSFIPAAPGQDRETVSIVGNLCTSADCFVQDIEVPRLEEGDLVVINNAGAYCQTTALWGFNSQPRGYPLKAGQPAKSGNCADRRNLFIAGLLPNSETSEPELLSRL
ncbi:MAG: hypothetical protein D3923_19760, partial [Candidatus Electrothrix sp. AR3]|nr:hypothetical protein [Candidatus Electrothrix sp. AR3]